MFVLIIGMKLAGTKCPCSASEHVLLTDNLDDTTSKALALPDETKDAIEILSRMFVFSEVPVNPTDNTRNVITRFVESNYSSTQHPSCVLVLDQPLCATGTPDIVEIDRVRVKASQKTIETAFEILGKLGRRHLRCGCGCPHVLFHYFSGILDDRMLDDRASYGWLLGLVEGVVGGMNWWCRHAPSFCAFIRRYSLRPDEFRHIARRAGSSIWHHYPAKDWVGQILWRWELLAISMSERMAGHRNTPFAPLKAIFDHLPVVDPHTGEELISDEVVSMWVDYIDAWQDASLNLSLKRSGALAPPATLVGDLARTAFHCVRSVLERANGLRSPAVHRLLRETTPLYPPLVALVVGYSDLSAGSELRFSAVEPIQLRKAFDEFESDLHTLQDAQVRTDLLIDVGVDCGSRGEPTFER